MKQKIQSEFINRYKEELASDLEENLVNREALLLQHPDNQALKDHVLNLQRSLQFFTDQIALHRTVSPEEVSAAVVFLSSDEASGITGQAFNVCGGMIMR